MVTNTPDTTKLHNAVWWAKSVLHQDQSKNKSTGVSQITTHPTQKYTPNTPNKGTKQNATFGRKDSTRVADYLSIVTETKQTSNLTKNRLSTMEAQLAADSQAH